MSLTSLRVASSLWRDVRIAVGPYRPHTMLVGPPRETASFVESLRGDLLEPIFTIDGACVGEIPPYARTIILRNVDALDLRGQVALMTRLESSSGTLQVVSVAEHPPFARVQRGLMMETLYRRLSLVYLVTDASNSRDGWVA
ncbi:MAG TPA: hypothetical protein VH497_14990 [Vicinamibacterales bacterium]|jgi:hypothetical protein